MRSVPPGTALILALVLSACAATPPPDVEHVGKVYSTLPTECFAGLEKALREVTGVLYTQRLPDEGHPSSTLPRRCQARFEAREHQPGPATRRVIADYWLFAGTGSARSDIDAARDLYRSLQDKRPEAQRSALPDNLSGFSWTPGHAAVLDGNLVVQFTVMGEDRDPALTDLPPDAARAAAAILAEAQLRNCSPTARC